MEKILSLDTDVFNWINHHNCTFADYLLWTFSQPWLWAIVLLSVFVFLTLSKEPKSWWLILVGVALCFLLADRISVLCFKDVFMRLRPCHALPDVRMIFGMTCGGQYGFISSHATNCFALAMFLSLWHKKDFKYLPYLLFAWALIVGYSRPYLGKHYPGDVICGALVGLIIGWGIYKLMKFVKIKINTKKLSK